MGREAPDEEAVIRAREIALRAFRGLAVQAGKLMELEFEDVRREERLRKLRSGLRDRLQKRG